MLWPDDIQRGGGFKVSLPRACEPGRHKGTKTATKKKEKEIEFLRGFLRGLRVFVVL
jgi:hypothetical protein